MRMSDLVAVLDKGRIRALGTPEAIRATVDPMVRQFIEGRTQGPIEVA